MYVGVYSTVYTCSTYSSKGGGLFSKGQQPASPGRGEGGGDRAFLLFVSQLRFFSEHLIRSKYSYILCTLWSAGVLCSTLLYAISLPTYICTTLGRYQDGIPTVLLYCAHHIYVGQSPWRNRSECRTTYLRYQYNIFHYFVMQLEALCTRSASKGPGYGWARWGHINLNYPIASYAPNYVAILMFPLPPPGRYVLDRLHRLLTYQL